MKRLFFFLSLVFLALAVFAQVSHADSVVVNHSGILDKIPGWIKIAIPALYEILVRVIPTAKNWSVLSLVMNLINFILPNNSKMSKTYSVTATKFKV